MTPPPATLIFRILPRLWSDPERAAELLNLLEDHRQTITEVAFITGFTHAPLPLTVIQERAQLINQLIPQVRSLGISAGINHLATIGHSDENLENSLKEPYQHLVDIDGSVSKSCYCAADPDFRSYVRQVYLALAQAAPDFIWVDDDMRMVAYQPNIKLPCFCPTCLANFSQQTGREWTRPTLKKAFEEGELHIHLEIRRLWLEHIRQYVADLLTWIRHAIDEVNPDLPMGLMTVDTPYAGYGMQTWSEAMAGERSLTVKWRPGGGFYEDAYPAVLLWKAHSTGRQIAFIPPQDTDIQYEHESFPYQFLRKSSTIFTAEVAAAIAVGCSGAAISCMGISSDSMAEYLPWFTALQKDHAFYQEAASCFGRSPCEGMWPAWTVDHQAALNPNSSWFEGTSFYGGHFEKFNELAEIGLPMAYARSGASLSLLSAENVLEFSSNELLELFSAGVVLDGCALQELQRLGLAEHAGFKVTGVKEKDALECFTSDPLNGKHAGWWRDCRPSFFSEKSYLLESLPDARPLSEIIDFTPRSHGICSGVFENTLGGRVAVLGYFPWRMFHTLAKTSQLKALFRWLSKDTLPAYIESFAKVALWCRRDPQGQPALLALNASLDRYEDLAVQVRLVQRPLLLKRRNGSESILYPVSAGGIYSRFILPSLDPWEPVLLRVL
jgi:hypothetical protein